MADLLELHLSGRLPLDALQRQVARAVHPRAAPSLEDLEAAAVALAPLLPDADVVCDQGRPGELCIRCRTNLARWWDRRDPVVLELLRPIG